MLLCKMKCDFACAKIKCYSALKYDFACMGVGRIFSKGFTS